MNTNGSRAGGRGRLITTALYIIVFWHCLPAGLAVSAAGLDSLFRFPGWPGLRTWGIILVFPCAMSLAISIIQYSVRAHCLPVSAFPPSAIIRSGIYGYLRHPIYLFYTATAYAAGLIRGSPSLLMIVLPVFTLAVIAYAAREEKELVRRFGADYRAYQEQTGIVIPRLYMLLKLPVFILSRWFFPIHFAHRERIPQKAPFFVVANHRNYLDPLIISYGVPYLIRYVTTYEMFRPRLSARWFKALGCIPRRRYRPDGSSVRKVLAALRRGSVIGIFPEGERSFTGVLQEPKPEVLKLLMKCRTVPILPAAVSGDYVQWPRWGRGWRRCPVTVTFGRPLTVGPNETARSLSGRIRDAIRPDDAGYSCLDRRRAHDIQQIIYRCPQCRHWDAIKPSGGSFYCRDCGKSYRLDGAYRVFDDRAGRSWSIDEAYRLIRASAGDLPPGPPAATVLLRSRPCACHVDRSEGLRFLFTGRVVLYRDRLSIQSTRDAARTCEIALPELGAATIEGADKLQCYDRRRGLLYQLTFRDESAKKWQDFLAAACASLTGAEPTLR